MNVSSCRNHGRSLSTLSAPAFFGELALLYAEPRSASVKCESASCRLYVLERDAFHTVLQGSHRVIGKIYSTAQEVASLKAHFIRKIPLFQAKAHDEEFMANMTLALESGSVAPGEFLVQQGDASDGRMYAIAHGHAEVVQVTKAGEPAKIVATLGPGDFFGEVALLLDTPRVASVAARGHCHFYTLRRDAFETLAAVYSDWWHELTSKRGVLHQKLESTGIGIGAAVATQTHGLKLPQIKGASASTMLATAMEQRPAAEAACRVPEERLCVVCREEEKCMLSTPCGHISACEKCQGALRKCPICRKPIKQGIRAFF